MLKKLFWRETDKTIKDRIIRILFSAAGLALFSSGILAFIIMAPTGGMAFSKIFASVLAAGLPAGLGLFLLLMAFIEN